MTPMRKSIFKNISDLFYTDFSFNFLRTDIRLRFFTTIFYPTQYLTILCFSIMRFEPTVGCYITIGIVDTLFGFKFLNFNVEIFYGEKAIMFNLFTRDKIIKITKIS